MYTLISGTDSGSKLGSLRVANVEGSTCIYDMHEVLRRCHEAFPHKDLTGSKVSSSVCISTAVYLSHEALSIAVARASHAPFPRKTTTPHQVGLGSAYPPQPMYKSCY